MKYVYLHMFLVISDTLIHAEKYRYVYIFNIKQVLFTSTKYNNFISLNTFFTLAIS